MTYEIELCEKKTYIHTIKFVVDNEEDGEKIADELEDEIDRGFVEDAYDAYVFISNKANVIEFNEDESPISTEIEVTGSDLAFIQEDGE